MVAASTLPCGIISRLLTKVGVLVVKLDESLSRDVELIGGGGQFRTWRGVSSYRFAVSDHCETFSEVPRTPRLAVTLNSNLVRTYVKGGAEGSRTLDLCIANAALSQLSYGPSTLMSNIK